MRSRTPKEPRFAKWMLSLLSKYEEEFVFCGDMGEEFKEIADERGSFKAHLWYWAQVLYAIPSYCKHRVEWSFIMIKNYLKITYRNMKKNKGYSFINIAGLSVGMAVFMLIILFVRNEVSYDRFHENFDRIYRIVAGNPQDKDSYAGTPAPLGPLMIENLPEIEAFVRLEYTSGVLRYGERAYNESRIFWADPSLFDVFTLPLLQGDRETALGDMSSIVLTESMAEKYFGDEDAMGKVLNLNGREDLVVRGVAKDVPENSHFHFDFLVRFERVGPMDHWGMWNYHTYLLLNDNLPPETVKATFDAWAEGTEMADVFDDLHYQPLSRIHFTYNRSNLEPAFNGKYIQVFIAAAFVILVLACINFINLATARASKRAREVGIRKTVGAHRRNLMTQFIGESFVVAVGAMMLAAVFIQVSLPRFNDFTGRNLALDLSDPFVLAVLAGLLGITGVLSGSYPALILSSYHPRAVLQGDVRGGRAGFRNGLVVFQFTISILLVACAIVISEQMHLVHRIDLGFQTDHVVNVRLNRLVRDRISSIKNAFLGIPSVVSASANTYTPANVNWHQSVYWQGKPEDQHVNMWIIGVDPDFFKTLKIPLLEGKVLLDNYRPTSGDTYVLNRSALELIGWETALEKPFSILGKDRMGRVIGVVEDFHFRSLHHTIEPCAMWVREQWSQVSVRVRSADVDATLAALKGAWNETVPDYPFDYYFLDDHFDTVYRSDTKLNQLIVVFTLLALFIACLGLFGLANFTAEQRTKEIGIRKVLGASVSGLMVLLSREYMKWVVLANLAAWPIAYYAMNQWLQQFAYRIDPGVWMFAASGLAALVIAWLTVSVRTLRAATANPVDSLRYE